MRASVPIPPHNHSRSRSRSRYANCAVTLLAALGAVSPPAVAQADAVRTAPGPDFAQQVLALINAQRAPLGLRAWQPDPALSAIASEHSRALAAQGRLSHDGFAQRFARADRGTCVENLAAGLRRPEALVAAWQTSPAHQRNLVAPAVHHAGIGQFNGFVVIFACD